MKAEIICIGSELLLGETINTNASYISKRLSELGIDCIFHTVVGDNEKRIHEVLGNALNRADLIITTGGLGPTSDDLSIQAIADFFHEKLIADEDSIKRINNFFFKINRPMPETNLKQAFRPQNAEPINNPVGTAPGIIWKLDNGKIIMAFPGVPAELYAMWEETAEKYLQQYSEGVLVTRHLKFTNIPEAALAEKVQDLLDQANPTVAPLIFKGEATLRVAAKAHDRNTAIELIDQMKERILARVGEFYYGSDSESMENIVAKLLVQNKTTLALAESCTGGLVSSRLTDIPGSSSFILLNLVTYSNESKIKILGVNKETLERYGSVSEQTAREMAIGVRNVSGCDIGVGITGIAGPTGGSMEKPVGLVYIGIANSDKCEVHKFLTSPSFDRIEIKYRFSQKALDCIRGFIVSTS